MVSPTGSEYDPQIFQHLPHKNPFYDISNALKYVKPLALSDSERISHEEQMKTIHKAYDQLLWTWDQEYIGKFHTLSKLFLEQYGRNLDHKTKKKETIQESILRTETAVVDYFRNFYHLSKMFLRVMKIRYTEKE